MCAKNGARFPGSDSYFCSGYGLPEERKPTVWELNEGKPAEPVPTRPMPAELWPTKPMPAEPVPTKPMPAELRPTKPVPTDEESIQPEIDNSLMTRSRENFYRHVAQTSEEPIGIEIEKADGVWLYSADGGAYVDLISGIAVSSLGHRHPVVLEAISKQLERHLHVMVYGEMIQKPQSDLAGLLTQQLPEKLDRVYFVNSGTESVEGALKLAKKYTGRSGFVSFENSYHGDTHGSLSVTGRAIYRDPYEPLLPNVQFLTFNDPEQLNRIDSSTAAVILEPIQGEGGVVPADTRWLEMVRKRCDETGALLIFDEIQTGYFRTGRLFAFQHYGVVPDILCMAKAMGGGMPIGGFVSSSEIFQSFQVNPPLNHVTTFGGHPVSCAAAHAALKELLDGGYRDKAGWIEETAREMLHGDGIEELRGLGALLGLQLTDRERARKAVEYALDHGVLVGWTLHSDTLIRIAPPLTIDEKTLKESLQVLLDGIAASA